MMTIDELIEHSKKYADMAKDSDDPNWKRYADVAIRSLQLASAMLGLPEEG